MATNSNGLVYENRTLQFYGCAYGNSNVSLNATINGSVVFSGEIPTVDSQISNNDTLLFSLENSVLFPTNWQGSLPMSITVTGGNGVIFTDINSNYMRSSILAQQIVMENSSIEGNVLTVGTVTGGTVTANITLSGTGVLGNTSIQSGSGSTWTVGTWPDPSVGQSVPSTTITSELYATIPGNATAYASCYRNGTPTNSENTIDPRSSVTIDGVSQVPPLAPSKGTWTWYVPTGSTISYNLNVSEGNCAQS
jgi:hypothetical protein